MPVPRHATPRPAISRPGPGRAVPGSSPALPRALPALLALAFAGPALAWTDAPLETVGDRHRVREGHVAPPGDLAADAERAGRGVVVGATPAHETLRRAGASRGGAATVRSDPYARGYAPIVGYRDEETWVADIGVLLRRDEDRDGFFGAVDLSIDVDTAGVERDVYAVIELRELDGTTTLSHVTRTFTVRGHATSDEYRIEIELLDDHPTAYRDVFIDVRDAWNDALLDHVSAFGFTSLAALPLEAERPFGPADDDHRHPLEQSDYALGALLGGSSSHGGSSHREGDAYVAGYAAGAGPLGALALLALTLLRRGARRVAGRDAGDRRRNRPGDAVGRAVGRRRGDFL